MSVASTVARAVPFYYGWVVVAVGASANTSRVVGSVEVASVFVAALIVEHGWSSTLLATATFIGSAVSALGGPLVGRVLDRRGPRIVTPVGTTLVALACFALAATDSVALYILFYAVVRWAGQGFVQFSSQITAAKWFDRRRGRAIALLALLSSAGLAIAPPVAQAVINGAGVGAAWAVFGVIALALGTIPSALLLVRRPEDMGLEPDGARRSADGRSAAERAAVYAGHTLREAARTPALWLIAPSVFMISAVMTGYGFHQLAFYVERGISATTGAVVISVFALGFSVGGVMWGALADRFSVRMLMTLLYGAGAALMLALLRVESPPEAFAAAFGFGFLVGGSIQLPTLLLASYFGRANLGAIGGVVHMARGFGLGGGPLIAGLIIEFSGYEAAWAAMAAMSACAALLMGLAARPAQPSRAGQDSSSAR